MIHPSYVKPYVRRHKNDRVDAAAICEAVGRPSMRFAAVKTIDQQAVQVMHRTRELLMQQRVRLGNALRAHLAEFGRVFPRRASGLQALSEALSAAKAGETPSAAQPALRLLLKQWQGVTEAVTALDRQLLAWHRTRPDSQRLATIPGIGTLTATAIVGAIGDGRQFRSGRDFAAWVGLVPRQNSSGGKDRLGRISKKAMPICAGLLVLGATMQLSGGRGKNAPGGAWFENLLRRKPARLATVALANKLARIASAVLTCGESYRATGPEVGSCRRRRRLPEGQAVPKDGRGQPPAG